MPVDPKIISSPAEGSGPSDLPDENRQSGTSSRPDNHTLNLWLGRTRALLLVTLCATFGVLLIIVPWTPKWTDNPLLLTWPDLRQIISNGFVRGLVSGVGLLDLWLGFWEAIHYHEN